jgi:hypothetical protein
VVVDLANDDLGKNMSETSASNVTPLNYEFDEFVKIPTSVRKQVSMEGID